MKYDEIISLGSNCCPGLSLRNLNLKKETYPFDWVRNNSKIIYDVLVNGKDKYLTFNNKNISNDFYVKDLHYFTHRSFKGSHINYYGQHFTHYTNLNTEELITKFNHYLDRFFNLLNSNKKVLFINSNEEYIYHKKSRDDKVILFDYLCKINDIIKEKYPNLTFEIINIDINNTFENYKDITNLNMNYDLSLSDNCEHHTPKFFDTYRNNITYIIKKFLKIYMEYLKNDKKMLKYWTETLDRSYCLNDIYPKIGSYLKNKNSKVHVLDIGLRDYNKYCKYYFNLKNINYDIIDIENKKEILDNIIYDHFYHNSICDEKFSKKNKNKYDCVLSFGVLGFYYFSNKDINIYLKNINKILKNDGIFILKLDYLSKYKNNTKKAKVNQQLINYWNLENFDDLLNKYFEKTNIDKINKNIYINDEDYYNFQCYKYKKVKKILVVFNNCKSMQNIINVVIELNKIYEVYFYFNHQTSVKKFKWNDLFISEKNDIRIDIKKKLLKHNLIDAGCNKNKISYDEQFKDASKYDMCIMDDSNGVWKGNGHGYNYIYQTIKKYNKKIKVIGNIEGLKDFNCKKLNNKNEFENLQNSELESICKSHNICYDFLFIWDKYQYNYVKKYVNEKFIKKVGLPYMDNLQKHKNKNLKKYIILFPSKTPNLVTTKWRAFDNYILDMIINYSLKLNCTLVIKEKPSKKLYYQNYKSENIIVNQVEGKDLDYYISNSKLIFGAPSTVLIRGLMLNIPTIIFDDNYYGQKGFLKDFYGLMKEINLKNIEEKYNYFLNNDNYIDNYMKNNFYGYNFESSNNFISNIKELMEQEIDNDKKINMKWNLGFLKKNSLNKKLQINEISNFNVNDKNIDKTFGLADPFIYKDYIFCELIDNSLKGSKINSPTGQNHKGGVIACAKIEEKLNFKIILKNKKFHYSYPYIFEINNILYMIPETHQSNQLQLYECIKFPYDWKLKKVLIDNFCCCDSTYFNLDGMHYIFTQKYVRNNTNESKTYLYKTNDLLNSKLVVDKINILKNGYRGGGNIIKQNNKIYIPIQPNEIKFYGEKLYIYEIIKKNNKIKFNFQNEIIKPNNIVGCHHISNYNETFVIDYIKNIK